MTRALPPTDPARGAVDVCDRCDLLVGLPGPWKSIDDLEFAVAEYVDWFDHRRLHGEIDLVPPAELEAEHEQQNRPNLAPATVEAPIPSLD